MELVLVLDGRSDSGGAPLLMHSEVLADPLNEWTKKIAKLTGKRRKTEADHLEIARLEFLGGMYVNGNGPALPSWNILRALQDGAKRHRRGPDVLRGVYPQVEHADVEFDGPRDPDELWKAGTFALRKSVGIQRRARLMRTRPVFTEWQSELPVVVDDKVFNLDELETFWKDAGVYCGIGDSRPIYGRFAGSIEVTKP